MLARPNDFGLFHEWLRKMSVFGNGQSQLEAEFAREILGRFEEAVQGSFGLRCSCGREGTSVRSVLVPSTSNRYVLCAEHVKVLDQVQALQGLILLEHRSRGTPQA